MTGPPRLLLASSSPRRRDLLAQIGAVPERIASPDIDESPHKGELPRDYAARMAGEKAQAVTRDPKGNATILVVGPENKVVPRNVKAPRTQGAF